jgi:hypothetical protein
MELLMDTISKVPSISLNLIKESFKEVFEGRNRFIYKLSVTKELDQAEKISWEYFINHNKYKFINTDNSVTDISLEKTENTHVNKLVIFRHAYFGEERYLKGEFNQEESDSRFISLVSDIFKQFIKWKEFRDLKPCEETKILTLEELDIKSSEYTLV